MVNVTHLAQFLLALSPQAHLGRMAFYHWVKNSDPLTAPITKDLIESFFSHALQIPHWIQNQDELHTVVEQDLEAFQTSYPNAPLVSEIANKSNWQIIDISSPKNIHKLIKIGVDNHHQESVLKIINLSNQNYLALERQKEGTFIASVYSTKSRLLIPNLEMLRPQTRITYNSNLELLDGAQQILQTGHSSFAFFKVNHGILTGAHLSGFNFQKVAQLVSNSIETCPEIFYPLKQLERNYIDLTSDPIYQEIATLLENAIDRSKSTHPDSLKIVYTALEKGKFALKNLFPNDKLISLLVTNLQYNLGDSSGRLSQTNRKPFLNSSKTI